MRGRVADRASAEEFYSRCLGNESILDAAARRFAGQGDAVSALATAWGADVYAAQAVVWERIMVAAVSPQRQFFRVAGALITGLHSSEPAAGDHPTVREVLECSRAGLLSACDPELREGVRASWSDHAYLGDLAAPDAAMLAESARARLGGLTPDAFVAHRRAEAAEAMGQAQALRIKGESVAAIEAAYDSDFRSLEAYLVESAVTAGDGYLLTVTIRWELAAGSVAALPGLPDGFLAAVGRIRDAIASGLGDADGARLREVLVAA